MKMLVELETLKLYLYIPQIGQFIRLNDVILKYLFKTQIPNFILNKYDKLKNIKLLFFMYLVLKFLDLLLSEILSPSMDPQAFWKRFQSQQYGHQI